MPHAPGVQRSWVMHFYPVRTAQDVIRWVGVIVVEITDQMRAEETLRKTEKLAAAGRLAASIAHEINNPLEAVTNLLYLLRTHDDLDDTATHLVATAEAELARVSEITQQTLRFYRQSTLPSRINIADILNSILLLYQSRITSANVTVEKKFCGGTGDVWLRRRTSPAICRISLATRSDAMPSPEESLRLRVRRGYGRRADGLWCQGVRVSVTDSGIGMSEAIRQRIFEAFFTTKEATGTGLGLWVSEEIIRKHSGAMHVKSRVAEPSGTSCMIFLPSQLIGQMLLSRDDSFSDRLVPGLHLIKFFIR